MAKKAAFQSPHIDPSLKDGDSILRHHLLIAMPGLQDSFFRKSVIYLCAHSAAGAMGIVINQPMQDVAFSDLLSQLGMPSRLVVPPVVHFGGPVEAGRGFVLHSMDFLRDDTVQLADDICVTGTVDILKAIADGEGPRKSIFALGYAGWGPGQLEAEIEANSWLTVPADSDLVFAPDLSGKWERALGRLGVNPSALSIEAGHA